MEFVVVINLSEETAKDLNSRKCNGLQVCGHHDFRELNNCTDLHGRIQSRVFYSQDVKQNETYKIILGDHNKPDRETSFTVPNNKEYIIIEFPD